MYIRIILIIIIFVSSFFSAQNSSIIYELTFKPSTNSTSTKAKTFFLDIIGNESVFRDDFRRQSDSLINYNGSYGFAYNNNYNDQIYIKKDLKKNIVTKYIVSPVSLDKFYINIDAKFNWKLLSDTQKIGEIQCQKAETDYGGRHWTAWFTQEIQIQEGPYVFHGLPGLIVQIEDSNHEYIFKLVKIRKFNSNTNFSIQGAKEITWETFKKVQQDFYTDPYSFVKAGGYKAVKDDGNGGVTKLDFREATLSTQEFIKKNDNIIELDKKIDYK
ncbi:GLPGLI family protein [Elizabethkingia meningoseptica]|uniref:GLPGLI family protein n=1 Tax=Elizabethkingia meningoseptica TaxID=238 RepID=UPI003892898A